MIIGIFGYKTAGKDSIADVIHRFYNFKKYSFAKPIKEAAKAIFGWTDEDFEQGNKETIDPFWQLAPRDPLLSLGTEWAQYDLPEMFPAFARHVGRNLWVKSFQRYYERNPGDYVISDMRFPHEQKALREMGAYFIKVKREISEPVDKNKLHESESYVDLLDYDVLIHNNGTIQDLLSEVQIAMTSFQGKET